MLTRLKVNGFKNLVDVDVRFGPFTCIAGPNAAGKSNLFDAIRFLSATAGKTLMEAALSVRSERASRADVRDLFHRAGGQVADHMSFEVEMIAPPEAVDDLGQVAMATANFLRYTLELRYRGSAESLSSTKGPLEIVKEELVHIQLKQAGKHLFFRHTASTWRRSALTIKGRGAAFISTEGEPEKRVIKLHQDGGGRGRGISNPATQPRTVLSVANAAECPTVLCAKREMESWQLLQLEPAALREPDSMNAPVHLTSNGAHLPSTLYHLARAACANEENTSSSCGEEAIYCRAANRLAELIDDVAVISVDRDEKRELLTLKVTGTDGATYPAKSLSDGTLRFLALTVLEMDSHARGVVCLEEPENGIHPERIPAMLRLLQDVATDPDEPVDESNPLRQVIVNTHSPAVVLEVPDDSLLVVESREEIREGQRFRKAVFSHLPDTWRGKADPKARTVPKGRLLVYLNPVCPSGPGPDGYDASPGHRGDQVQRRRGRRVADREDLQLNLPYVAE
jgi:predicted ATPase